ncbi:MAG: hypothetical protein ABSD79_00075 [Dehalococcoidales bacterium]|jgi:hypothetical protein
MPADNNGQGLSAEVKKQVADAVSEIVCLITKESMRHTFASWRHNLDQMSERSIEKLERRLAAKMEKSAVKSCEESVTETKSLLEGAISNAKMSNIGFLGGQVARSALFLVGGAGLIAGGAAAYGASGGFGGNSVPVTQTVTLTTPGPTVTNTQTVTTTQLVPGQTLTVTAALVTRTFVQTVTVTASSGP